MLNKVTLIGYLGKDPEMKTLENGSKVCNFSIAIDESYNDKSGNKVEKTEWFNITTWREVAERAAKFLKKGSRIYLEGKLETDEWTDKETGAKRTAIKVIAYSFIMLDGKKDSNLTESTTKSKGNTAAATAKDEPSDAVSDDAPF